MNDSAELAALLAAQPSPACAKLTPFEIVEADFEIGYLVLQFTAQPAFENHWGNIQGGFGVALIDVLISIAAYAKLRRWCPTIEIKCSFLAPAVLGACRGEARVLKAGSNIAFLEARLWGGDGQLAIHSTATVSLKS